MNSLKKRQNIEEIYKFHWPQQLCTPSELVDAFKRKTRLRIIKSPLCSKIILQIVGSWAYFVANVLNKSEISNYNIFLEELQRIEELQRHDNCDNIESKNLKERQRIDISNNHSHTIKAPLLTFSNHISCIDDPVLWGSLLPSFNYYSMKTDSVRWTAAAVDICFTRSWHSTFFALGKTFPITRGGVGLNQPAMDFACALLNHNHWLHLFPEGRVMRDQRQEKVSNLDRGYIFKWGISKLILDYFKKNNSNNNYSNEQASNNEKKIIKILPFYHLGLDEILPIGWPYLTRINKRITILIRPQVIEMDGALLDSILVKKELKYPQLGKSWSNDEITRIKLTNYLEEEMEKLIEPATKLHRERCNQEQARLPS